jgi:hypothetical protein
MVGNENGAIQIESKSFTTDYVHHQRIAVPGPDFVLPSIQLKWYQIHRPGVEISDVLIEESRRFIKVEIEGGRLKIANEFGFVMLHLGDEPPSRNTFAMLFACTWRNNNELWRTLYTKSLGSDQEYTLFMNDGHIGAFCVWELGVVLHEREAWNRYLYTGRDEKASLAYYNDKVDGPV